MERYPLEKAQDEAQKIQNRARELKENRSEQENPAARDYKNAFDEIINSEFSSWLEKAKKVTNNIIMNISPGEDPKGQKRTKKIRDLFSELHREKYLLCRTTAENNELLLWMNELEGQGFYLDGDSISRPYGVFASMLYKEKMNDDDIKALIEKNKKIAFIGGLLSSGGAEILGCDKFDNESIIELGKKLLKKIYDSDDQLQHTPFDIWKTHEAYMIWTPLGKFLKLENMTAEQIIDLGFTHNESYLWRELVLKRKETQDEILKLPEEKRFEIATKISKLYAPLIGYNPDDKDIVSKIENFGGPVSNVISLLIEK